MRSLVIAFIGSAAFASGMARQSGPARGLVAGLFVFVLSLFFTQLVRITARLVVNGHPGIDPSAGRG